MRNERIHLKMALFGAVILVNALWTLGNVIAYPIILIRSFLEMKKDIYEFEVAISWYFQGILLSWPIYLSAILQLIGYAVCGIMYVKAFVSYRSGRYIKRASIVYFVAHFQYVVVGAIMFEILPNCIYFIPAILTYIAARDWDKYAKDLAGQMVQSAPMKWPYWRAIVAYKKNERTVEQEIREK